MSGAAVGIGTSRASIERSRRTQTFIIHAVLIAGGIIVMIPLAWMLSTSLKPPHQITKFPPIWIPDPFVWSNYVRAVTIFPVSFVVFVRNSMYMSLMITLGTVLSNAVVAFAFARLTFRGSRVLFIIVLSTMMLPQQVTMIPLFILFSKFGWINTYNPLIVPHFFANAYFVFSTSSVLYHHPTRAGRRGANRRLRRNWVVPSDYAAVEQAGPGHYRHLRLYLGVE